MAAYQTTAVMPTRLPSLFVSHGAPTLALADSPAHHYLGQAAAAWPRPRAIVVVSAHQGNGDRRRPRHATAGDHARFLWLSRSALRARIPGTRSAALAATIATALTTAGLACELETARGYDHGAWIPLLLMYPQRTSRCAGRGVPGRR